MKSFFFLLFISMSAQAQVTCFHDLKGCLFIPENNSSTHLLIYLRGHFEGQKPPYPASLNNRKRSLEEAKKTYDLHSLNTPVLYSSNSAVIFSKSEIEKIMTDYQLTEVSLASHSGSYVILTQQMIEIPNLKKVMMLDNFYMSMDSAQEFSDLFNSMNIACFGFYTDHNSDRFNQRFTNLNCKVETGYLDHISSVKECLGKYLIDSTCRP